MIVRKTLALCLPALLAACASQPSAPPLAVPDNLRPAANETLHSVIGAKGVQIYECRTKKDQPSATEWAFVAPEAELYDAQGKLVGKHYGGPHWEASDGSKVVGAVKARADAPLAGAIPWLLLGAKSVGPAGTFSKITSIQRVSTVNGVAPSADSCTAATLGKQARVGYTADYRMFAAP
jgi:hypothetical protein